MCKTFKWFINQKYIKRYIQRMLTAYFYALHPPPPTLWTTILINFLFIFLLFLFVIMWNIYIYVFLFFLLSHTKVASYTKFYILLFLTYFFIKTFLILFFTVFLFIFKNFLNNTHSIIYIFIRHAYSTFKVFIF